MITVSGGPDPYASFRFVVSIDGFTQGIFTDCTLPSIEWDVQEIKEGGLNTYTHQLPGRRKGAKVTLKRGLIRDSMLAWYTEIMGERFAIARKRVDITLLDSRRRPVLKWSCSEAYPTKWSGPELKSADSSVAAETLELACAAVTFQRL